MSKPKQLMTLLWCFLICGCNYADVKQDTVYDVHDLVESSGIGIYSEKSIIANENYVYKYLTPIHYDNEQCIVNRLVLTKAPQDYGCSQDMFDMNSCNDLYGISVETGVLANPKGKQCDLDTVINENIVLTDGVKDLDQIANIVDAYHKYFDSELSRYLKFAKKEVRIPLTSNNLKVVTYSRDCPASKDYKTSSNKYYLRFTKHFYIDQRPNDYVDVCVEYNGESLNISKIIDGKMRRGSKK